MADSKEGKVNKYKSHKMEEQMGLQPKWDLHRALICTLD